MTSLAATTVRPLPLASDDQTRGGSYFVSNYPPFSYWSPDQAPEIHRAMATPPDTGRPLGLYVHIPFCRKRCHFCYFKVYTDKNASAIQRYIDAVLTEMRRAARQAFIGGRPIKFVYFGGGTPSYLSAQQLTQLTDGLKEILSWSQVEEVTFECEPGTLNEKKVQAIRDMGVTRLSFGIENFSDPILEINGRAHLSKQVYAAYEWARAAGFPQINIDLIAGMVEETDENWQNNVASTLALTPDCITIYQMEIPYNTTIYQQMKTDGKLTAPVADWNTKRRWVKYAFDAFENAGYGISSAYTAVRDPARTKFVYRDLLWRGADLLALGVASFGHIGGVHYQNVKDIEPYCQTIESGAAPLQRAYRLSADEALIRQFILQLKLGELDAGYFRKTFGVEVAQRFAAPLKQLADAGFLTIAGDRIRLDRDALLQVDRLLHEFFLPEHRGA